MKFKDLAEKNLTSLRENSYPGRGIVVGQDESGENLIQVYWIMGRSANSRNRFFVSDCIGELKVEALDEEKVENPELIIYTAMSQRNNCFAVSNGHQTKDALSAHIAGLYMALSNWKYEPDAPNYTPRISATVSLTFRDPFASSISIIKKSPFSMGVDHHLFSLRLAEPGIGYCITTYAGDGDPLPSFSDVPYMLPLRGDIKQVAKNIWDSLNEDNRVSLAVKFINVKSGEVSMEVINKYKKD